MFIFAVICKLLNNNSNLVKCGKLAETARIVDDGSKSIKAGLERLIQQKKLFGKIESNPDGSGSCFIKGKDERQIQTVLQENLLENKVFLKEFHPKIVFSIPPSINKQIDEIVAEAKYYDLDTLVKEAEDLKKDFFKED